MRWTRRGDADFQAEIESHIELETDRLVGEGMAPEAARAAARRAFGNAMQARETFFVSQRWMWTEHLRQDVRYALRTLRASPGFGAAVVLTIALGVGASTAMFRLVDAILLRTLPVSDPKSLVFLSATGTEGPSGAPPYPVYERMRREMTSLAGLAAFASDEMRVEVDGQPEQVMTQCASGNYFGLLGVRAVVGRVLQPEDESMRSPAAVISYRYWQRRFGGDPAVLGKTIRLRNDIYTIVGVTAAGYWGLEPGRPVDLTVPITMERGLTGDSGAWWFEMLARLKPGVPEATVRAEADAIFKPFVAASGHAPEMIRKHFSHMRTSPAEGGLGGLRQRFSNPLRALMGMALAVLLIATANIANLLLSRGTARRREFAIRLATGAGSGRLVGQIVTETLVLFVLGAVPGVFLADWGVAAILSLFAEGRTALVVDVSANWRVLGFSLAATLAAAMLAALTPAMQALRAEPQEAMGAGHSRMSESRGARSLGRWLVGAQVALSLVLLVGASAFVRTLANLRGIDLGFRVDEVVTMSLETKDGTAGTGAMMDRALAAVRAAPGVQSAALCVYTPLSGRDRGEAIAVPGRQMASFEDSLVHVDAASGGYFETMGMTLLRGRLLADSDRAESPAVVVINEETERHYFPDREAIGQTIGFGVSLTGKPRATNAARIVGVVRDSKHMSVREKAPRFVFVPLGQRPQLAGRLTLALHSGLAEGAAIATARRAVTGVSPDILITEAMAVRTQVNSKLLSERLVSGLSSVFGALALSLAAIGLYGVLSYRIGQQRKAIGIRMALGAAPSAIAADVVRQSAWVIGGGLAVGLPLSIAGARAAESMLWGLRPTDLTIYEVAAALLLAVGLVSAYLPARRASSIDPAEALRHD